ncbi:MAG: transcriptional regulator [Micrococcales bacterium]|nr:transcriptional regulator [Micrococcales bacterium]NBR54666.1 transcriptional regulator [Micrococcales bacterium]NBR62034.1 transcriptional regulator [Actinomycetota bacterium]NBT46712.1 transcriptional regulator [Actinomycetota bacterium]NBY43562.1 transcriptional regulator [Micrococcales bacterium]
MPIVVDFEKARAKKKLTVAQLADLIGITQANLFVLKSNRGKAIRFSTLEALCRVLDCQPADILNYVPETELSGKSKQ